jgi:glycosyltransferase involved in cell wall biosynthesis
MYKVILKAPVLSRSGYGEHSRFVLRSLMRREDIFDIYVMNINWGATGLTPEDTEERRWIDFLIHKTIHAIQEKKTKFDISLQVTIPNEWERIATTNIGITAGIETNMVSPMWIQKTEETVDKIIVTSEHAKTGFLATVCSVQGPHGEIIRNDFKCTKPIEVVGYPAKDIKPVDIGLELSNDFNFLCVAQWSPRKNLENTIRWFVEEFFNDDVGLVVKANFAKNSVYDRYKCEGRLKALLQGYPGRKCKIHLLHGGLRDEEVYGLYKHDKIKAIINLAHGEGFGLPLFEAAQAGLPVVAPDWSGHLDFLYMPVKNKKGKTKNKAMFAKVGYELGQVQPEARWEGVIEEQTSWCFPDPKSYKVKLREIYKDQPRFRKHAKDLQSWISEEFEAEKMYKKMSDAILEAADSKIKNAASLPEEHVQVFG